MIWLCLFVPIVTAVILLVLYSHKTLWWEFLIPFAASLFFILIFKSLGESSQTQDVEYWTGWGKEARYYEDWNEYIHKTCSREECSGTGENRSCHTEYYDCSYVDYHPEYWQVLESNNQTLQISKAKFEELSNRWGNRKFVDLGRDYHTNDGDMYATAWDGKHDTMEVLTTEHSYENRVAATNNTYQFPEVAPEETLKYGLWAYPPIYQDHQQPSLLGAPGKAALKLSKMNALLGKKKQVKVFILLYKDKPLESSFYQEWLWKGGNKNELVITIGTDSEDKVTWARTFSWSDKEASKVESKELVLEQQGKRLDLHQLVDKLHSIVDDTFVRKEFSDFSYIDVQPTAGQVIFTFIFTLALNVGISVFVVKNEFKERRNIK